MESKAATVDEYLVELPADRRAALAELRTLIRAGSPDAAEGMAYGMPSDSLGGPPFGQPPSRGGRLGAT